MEETKKTGSMNNKSIGYLLVVVGVIALVAAYFLSVSGFTDKRDKLDDEIDVLESQVSELEMKATKYNKADVEAYVAECKTKTDEILGEFEGGITYQSQIMDTYNMTKKFDIQIPELRMSEPTDIVDESEAVTYLTGKQYVLQSQTYEYSTVTTYDQMKDVIEYIMKFEGRRKVPKTLTFAYDTTQQKVGIAFAITEYAIKGEDRPMSEVDIPDYKMGNTNIFYNAVVK